MTGLDWFYILVRRVRRKYRQMKKYRCIFKYATGQTTMQVEAHDAENALKQACEVVTDTPQHVEVWDETGLVLQRRAWNDAAKPHAP